MSLPLAASAATRVIEAEATCMVSWLSTLREQPGNPFGVSIQRFGGATAVVARGLAVSPVFNRVIGFRPPDLALLDEILRFYRDEASACCFDLSSYHLGAGEQSGQVLAALATRGFYQSNFHMALYGAATTPVPDSAAGIEVRDVRPTGVDAFVACYNTSFGGGDVAAVLLGRPDWRLYLAYVDERPAAMGMLHLAAGVGTLAGGGTRPDLRNRGAQTELIQRRIADAAAEGCDLVAS